MTVSAADALAIYLRHLEEERHLSALTVRNYRQDIEGLFGYLSDIDHLDRETMREYLTALKRKGAAPASLTRCATPSPRTSWTEGLISVSCSTF